MDPRVACGSFPCADFEGTRRCDVKKKSCDQDRMLRLTLCGIGFPVSTWLGPRVCQELDVACDDGVHRPDDYDAPVLYEAAERLALPEHRLD